MPTALDEGRYSSKGFQLGRHVQRGRATGLPAPSIWASAASSWGAMTAVECSRNRGPYWRQVSSGVFASAPPTGKNISEGLRTAWTIQFAAPQSARTAIATARTRIAGGAAHRRRSARRTEPETRPTAVPSARRRILGEGPFERCERYMGRPLSYPVKSPAKGLLMHENDVSAEKLAADLRLVISDAEALLRATDGQAGEATAAARAKMQESLESAKLKLGPLGEEAAEQARAAGRAADDYVRANPWQAVGIAALVGIALGLLISRR